MDVRIGEITADVDVTGDGGTDDALVRRISRAVLAQLDARERTERRVRRDVTIASPDDADVERYG